MSEQTYDVIVVGAGGSGLAAAASAARRGAKVVVLEKQPQPGGTTGIAVGSFTTSGTRLQREAGIDDNPCDHAEDAGKFAAAEIESQNNAELRDWFLTESTNTLEWLESLGVSFVGPSPEPPNRVPRMHNVVPGAKAYIAALQLDLQHHGGKLLCDADVTSLVRECGRVVGVTANVAGRAHTLRAARGVILAAGDYANNADIIGRHLGDEFRTIEGINPYAGGDGHLLAQSVGAQLRNMQIAYGPELRFVPSHRRPFQQWLPAGGLAARLMGLVARRLPAWVMRRMIKRLLVTWQHPEVALFDNGAVLLNARGERFVDETRWPDREIGVARQPDRIAYILLDGRLVQRYSAWPHFVSTAPDIAYAYVGDYERLRPDVTHKGRGLVEVAHRAGLPPEAVAQSVAQFNAYVANECGDAHGRSGDAHPLERGPWVLLGPVKAYFTTTEGGAAVNRRLQVLDAEGRVIPGLYAVGQNGLGGMVLWGHGLHIAWAMTSGRLAGQYVLEEQPA